MSSAASAAASGASPKRLFCGVGAARRQDLCAGDVGDPKRVGPHGPGDVLERLLAEVDELSLDPATHMIVGGAGDAYAARLADGFEPRCDIDAVAQNILAVDQHVAEIDADAVEDASGLGNARVAFGHLLLHANRALDRRDDRRKFQQHAVAHRLDEPAAESANDRRRRLAMFPHRARRPRFVIAHQPRVADDVGGEDRGEAAGLAHSSGIPALRRPSYTRSFASTRAGSPPCAESVRLPCRDRLERPGGGQREVALQRLARFRIMTGQGERRHKDRMRPRDVVRIDRDRLASQFNRLVITLQPEIGPRLAAIPIGERRIVRARQNRLVEIFNAFVEFPEAFRSRSPGWRRRPRWTGPGRARARARRRLPSVRPWARRMPPFTCVSQVQSGSRASALDSNSSARSRSPLGSPETPSAAGSEELDPQPHQGADIVGIDGERLFAERVCRIRLLADRSGLPLPAEH